MTTGFVPGVGVGIIGDGVHVLVEHPVGNVVAEVQAQLGNGVDGVLEALAAAGLRTLGSFAVAVDEGTGLRVVVRGDAWVRVVDAGESVLIEGAGLRTWNERLLTSSQQVTLGLGQQVEPPSQFELDRGVVPAVALVHPNVFLSSVTTPVQVPEDVADDAGFPGEVAEHQVEVSAPEPHDARHAAPPADVAAEAARAAEPDEDDLPVDSAQTLLPSAIGADGEPPALIVAAPAAERATAPPPEANAYDDLYGHTVHREVQSAAVHAPQEPIAEEPVAQEASPPQGDHDGYTMSLAELRRMQQAEAAASPRLGDHDGQTVSVAELRALQAAGGVPDAGPAGPVSGVTVQALVCASGHPNPTHASACAKCGLPLGAQPVVLARPPLGRLLLSTGDTVVLDKSVILGRNPRVEGRLVGELPRTVRLESYQGLSRSHAMVRLEGWQVLLVDLGSANSTTLTLPGRAPQRLRPDEPTPLADGALIDLGGEVTIRYEANG